MVMKIDADNCIDCGACVEPCPNDAVYAGGEEYEYKGQKSAALSDKYYIVPDKCTECEGVNDKPQCKENCPVDCIAKV
ncbi:MAG: hypothetical protein A2Z34_11280 [Planctomycetes bacterium RBG_16_59_8]|nr:MAG: hypothetical protein A2Z34_11280 [Planctomycetes bacterium RBG_16_59_8]